MIFVYFEETVSCIQFYPETLGIKTSLFSKA